MSSTGQALSTQDLQDLDQIRQALPPNDPRVAKIHALVGANAQQPTQFEKERDPNNQPGFWKTAWSDVKNLVPSPEFSASDIPVFGSAIGAAKNLPFYSVVLGLVAVFLPASSRSERPQITHFSIL